MVAPWTYSSSEEEEEEEEEHRCRSSVNFRGGHDIFARKICIEKNNKLPEFYMILAWKIIKIMIFARKINRIP